MSQPRRQVGGALVVGALLIASASGCGDRKKVQECRALITVINGGVEQISAGTKGARDGGAAVGELRDLATAMDTVAKAAAKVELEDLGLKKLAKGYRDMVAEVAAAARELATAVDKVDIEKMKKAQRRMDKAVSREGPIVDDLNKHCQEP